jgi:excisionase family DNA binding protein
MSDALLFTVADVSRRLRCSISNVYALVAQGELRCYRVGAGKAGLRFDQDQIRDFLRSRETKQKGGEPQAGPAPGNAPATGFTVLDGERLQEAWKGRR